MRGSAAGAVRRPPHSPALDGRSFIALTRPRLPLMCYVQVSRTPASQNHPRTPTTGVREAPRHEIAGRRGLGSAAAIYGDLRSSSVGFREVGITVTRHFDGLICRGERAPPALG